MCNLWAGSGSRLLVLGLKRKDQRCQFGFGGGSRPSVFFRRCLLMEQLDLGLQAGLLQTRRVPVSAWVARVWLEAACFGSGSVRSRGSSGLGVARPSVFFRRCLPIQPSVLIRVP